MSIEEMRNIDPLEYLNSWENNWYMYVSIIVVLIICVLFLIITSKDN